MTEDVFYGFLCFVAGIITGMIWFLIIVLSATP